MRKILLIVVSLLMSLTGTLALAQADPFCGNLPEADCQILINASQAVNALNAASFTLNTSISIAELPQPIRLEAAGAYIIDPVTMPETPVQQIRTPEQFGAYLTALFSSLNARMNLTIDIPTELSAGPALQNLALPIRIVEGNGYVNLDQMSAVDPSLPAGWHGINLIEAADVLAQQMDQMFLSGTVGMGDAEPYATVERLPNETITGQEVAVFRTTTDMGAFFSDPAVQETLGNAVQIEMFQNGTLTTTRYIGLDNYYLYRLTSVMSVPAQNASFEAQLELALSDFNSVQPVEAPEGAQVYPLQQLGVGAAGALPMVVPTPTPAG